jgi:hypothetical protein
MENDTMIHPRAPWPDIHATSLLENLRRMSLATGGMLAGYPVAPPIGAAHPVGGRSISLMAETMPPQTLPYGLNTVAQQYASSVSTNMGAYEELPRHHLRSALDLVASAPAFEYRDSMETPDLEPRAIASRCYDPRDRRPHMHSPYYYFGAPDSDSADDSYDLTREYFHIDGAIALDSEAEAVVEGRNATPPHIELSDAQDGALFLGAAQEAQLEQIQELQARLDEERENLRLL